MNSIWITNYAPLAPVHIGSNPPPSDYILKTLRNSNEVEIDGSLNLPPWSWLDSPRWYLSILSGTCMGSDIGDPDG